MKIFKNVFESAESKRSRLKEMQEPEFDLIAQEMYYKLFAHLKEGVDKRTILSLLKMTMYKSGISSAKILNKL